MTDLRDTLRRRFEIGAHPLAFRGAAMETRGGLSLTGSASPPGTARR